MNLGNNPVRLPTFDEICDIADKYKFGAETEQLKVLHAMVNGTLASFERTQALVEPGLEQVVTKQSRSQGCRRPTPDENPLNAWYWKTDIEAEEAEVTSTLLKGKTVALKDNVCLAGVPMMNGSRVLEGFIPQEDATIVTRILRAGGRIVGKATCEDLCLSGGSHTTARGPVRNPHNPGHSAGGSSSGSAALVVNGDVDVAIACDQGGSIRIPAGWCGAVGHKPTHGLVPYTGIFAMEPTLDHAGPVSRTVTDAAALLEAIAGPDGHDARSLSFIPSDGLPGVTASLPTDVVSARAVLAEVKIGVLTEGFGFPVSEAEVDAAVRAVAFETLAGGGATVSDVSVPMHLNGPDIWSYIGAEGIVMTQFRNGGQATGRKGYHNAELMRAMKQGLQARGGSLSWTNKLFVLIGEHLAEQYGGEFYGRGQNLARSLAAAYDSALRDVDILLMPTLPMRATELPSADVPIDQYIGTALAMIPNTCPFNATGHPALTMPAAGQTGLPISFMMVGRQMDDATLLRVARAYELISSQ